MTGDRRTRSLFWAIAAAFLGAALLGTLAQTLVAVAVLRPLEARDLRARAELAAGRLAHELSSRPARADSADTVELLRRVRAEAELRLPILYRGADGLVVADRPERARQLLEALEGAGPERPADRSPDGKGERWRLRVMASRTVLRSDGPAGRILVLQPQRPGRGIGATNTNALLLSLPIALLASLVAALVMVRLLVRRLRALERFAARVAEDDLTARVEDARSDEIGRLAEGFNRMAERLAAARDRLDRQEAQRRQLFADITHELATPLTSIRGYTETLLDPRVPVSDEERVRYLRDMLAEARRLDRLIRDLFDLARMEAGATPLEMAPLDWVALCRNVAQRFEARFRAAGLRVEWRDSPAEAWIVADGQRIEQVLENLLNNALRYVPPGRTVSLSMTPVGPDGEPGRFRLTVSDDGPGLPAEEIPRVFERFYRAPGARGNGREQDLGGSGLGLAIVREIVHRHGGSARARARAPQGLAIEVELPARV